MDIYKITGNKAGQIDGWMKHLYYMGEWIYGWIDEILDGWMNGLMADVGL